MKPHTFEAPMHTLFPQTPVQLSYFLQVSKTHKIYVEQSGNMNGIPVLLLHGGPGSGIGNSMKRMHDPEIYRIITFDQRGCGQSLPTGCLEENTTQDLIADIEKIRAHMQLDSFHVCGASFGSTLALAYAQRHPARVRSLLVRGIFFGSRKEINWYFQSGANLFFPEEFVLFQEMIVPKKRGNLLEAYGDVFLKEHKLDFTKPLCGQEGMKYVAACHRWLGAAVSLLPLPAYKRNVPWNISQTTKERLDACIASMMESDTASMMAAAVSCTLQLHYFQHACFLEKEEAILHPHNLEKLKDIPTWIVQGRYDLVTPFAYAYALFEALPHAKFHVVDDAGHLGVELGIADAMIAITKGMA